MNGDNIFGTDPRHLVRRDGTDTSREAAHSIDTTKLEMMVYEAIKAHGINGCISDRIREMYPKLPYSSVTARYRALLDRGLIVDSGARMPGRSGRNQRVLVASCWIPKEVSNAVHKQAAPIQERVSTAEGPWRTAG